jgi:hypothetical protein
MTQPNRPPCGNLAPHDQHPLNGGADFADQGWCPGVPNLPEPAAPRVWSVPSEPGRRVTAVTDKYLRTWRRHDSDLPNRWCFVDENARHAHLTWRELVVRLHPLTDATPDGAGKGFPRSEDSTAGDSGTPEHPEPRTGEERCSYCKTKDRDECEEGTNAS